MKVGIYVRNARKTDNRNQECLLRGYADMRRWEIYKVYIDNGYSGNDLDRPALQELLNDLDKLDLVLVSSLDRLSRSNYEVLKNNVELVSVN